MVAAHSVVVLEMADHGLDGGTTPHLAADGFGDAANLAAERGLEPVGIVLAAIALVAVNAARCNTCELFEVGDDGTERVAVIGIAVQGLGMQHELPAFGRGGRRGNRDFATKLVRCPGLAFADALHLGGAQRVDLGTALTLLLMANPVGEIEQRTKAILKRRVALDLASDVTDDAAKPGAQEFEFSPGTLDLFGIRVAPHHNPPALG